MEISLNTEKIELIFKKGLSPNTYLYLMYAKEGDKEMTEAFDNYNTSMQLWLITGGCLNPGGNITDKGKKILEEINVKEVSKKVDTIDFVKLHKKLQDELLVLTGKKQKVLNLKFSFLPNSKDLELRLLKVAKKYNLTDWNRIEKLLIAYIYTCHKAKWEMVQLVEYYISKGENSRLATDYLNFEEKEEQIEVKQENNQVFDL